MHDRDELRSESGLYITSDMLDCGGDGVLGSKRGVYDNAEMFHL